MLGLNMKTESQALKKDPVTRGVLTKYCHRYISKSVSIQEKTFIKEPLNSPCFYYLFLQTSVLEFVTSRYTHLVPSPCSPNSYPLSVYFGSISVLKHKNTKKKKRRSPHTQRMYHLVGQTHKPSIFTYQENKEKTEIR